MNPAPRRAVQIQAPAKLNLGLEILARRLDGFHNLATIFVTVSLCDTLTVACSDRLQLTCDDLDLDLDENLALRAVRSLQRLTPRTPGASILLQKGIPVAAGLGGASSDAAAALIATRALWRLGTSDEELARVAGQIGSDVPFFLRGGCAAGSGRGEVLESLPLPANVHFVVVTPRLVLPWKTPSLYAALQTKDLSNGATVAAQASRLRAHLDIDSDLLGNAFSRPLYELAPALVSLSGIMRRAGADVIAISGAGPTHYAAITDPQLAHSIASTLRGTLGSGAGVFVVAPVPERSGHPDDYDVS